MHKHRTPSSERLQPLVSIVTPAYNALPYLWENIESVRSQDYSPVQHIIIDGGSSDGTRELLESYPHLDWVSEPDRGQSQALNKGFQRAQGEIIGWLNADDTYQPGAVSIAVRFLLEHPQVDLVYSDLQVIDENSQPVGITRGQPFELDTIIFQNYVNQPTVFMRRHVIEELGGVDEDLHYAMDRELWMRAGLVPFEIKYLQGTVLANFRLCQGTKSYAQTPEFRAEWLRVLDGLLKTPAFSHLPAATRREAIKKTKAQYHGALMLQSIEQHDRKKMFTHLLQATAHDPGLLTNRGTWYFLGKGIFGLDIDRLRKFRK